MALRTRRVFLVLWLGLLLLKGWLACTLPLFEDEAWYWLEGRHPAWAYSDLPGLTAWMARFGTAIGGNTLPGLRWPFLLMGAAIPWLAVRIGSRWFGGDAGWRAGILAMLLPLGSAAGLLAVPDLPLAFATLLAFDACLALLGGVTAAACVQLALGLSIGANSHYRFAIALGAAAVGLLASREGRALLRDGRVLAALAAGALAWLPVALFNLDEHAAGLRFQFVDRHPWAFHAYGLKLQAAQPLLVGPLLYAAIVWALWQAWKRRADPRWRLLLGAGGLQLAIFVALAPFVDIERVSFHWTVPAYLVVLVVVPWLLVERRNGGDQPSPFGRWNAWILASNALLCATLWSLAAQIALPGGDARLARIGVHPKMFASLDPVVDAARSRLAAMPAGSALVADHFALAAKLAFAFDGTRRVTTLDHRLNTKHGRALQLALWGEDERALPALDAHPVLLVVDEDVLDFERREPWNRHVCKALPGLRDAGEVAIDDARQHFLLYRRDAAATGACAFPSLAYLRQAPRAVPVGARVVVEGWAFQDAVGVARVDILMDDRVVAVARYGIEDVEVRSQWPESDDPNQPGVGFVAQFEVGPGAIGEHELALRVTGRDGRVRVLERRRLAVVGAAGGAAEK